MRFLARRLVFYIIAFFFAITLNFAIPRLMPGDAVQSAVAKFPGNVSSSEYKALVIALGVGNQGSILNQYWDYLVNLAHGDFGTSLAQYPAQVWPLVWGAIPWTVLLVGTVTVISFLIGTLYGVGAAWRRGGWLDRVLPGFAFFQAVPYFFLALIVLELFAIRLHIFPPLGGYADDLVPGWNLEFIGSAVYHSILPAITIILASMSAWMLQMRNMMIATLGEDYMIVANAKGLSDQRLKYQYAARNAILPSISAFSLALGFVVAGSLVMEIVFSYPGIGLLLFNAVTSNDYPMAQAIFLFIALFVLVCSFLADLVYVLADPRVRVRGAAV